MPINPNEITWDAPQADSGIVWDQPQQSEYRGANVAVNSPEFDAMRKKFIADQGTMGTRIKEGAKGLAAAASPYIRPVLEGGGAALGAIAGIPAAPETLGLSSVGGAGLGYAMGKNLADTYDEALGLRNNGTLGNRLATAAGDVATGANLEMGGQIAARIAAPVLGWTAGKIKQGVPWGQKAAQVEAGSLLDANNAASAISPEVQQLMDKGAKFTNAQQTGDLRQAMLEQSLTAKDPELAARLMQQEADNQAILLGRVQNALGKGADMPVTRNSQEIGDQIRGTLAGRATAAKNASQPLWDAIPNYEMPSTSFDDVAAALSGKPLGTKHAEDAVAYLLNYSKDMPRTVEGMQGLERTVNDIISAANRSGDRNTVRILGKFKDAIGADFEALSSAASSGDIALHEGRIVRPSELKAELDALQRQKLFPQGGMAPTGQDAARLDANISGLENKISQLQPAEDVATAYSQAKQFSKEQYFDKFRRGTVDNVLAKGNTSNGYRISDEAIGRKIFTPTGANDIVTALGQPMAGSVMKDHAINEIAKNKTVPQMMNWINRNKPVLEKLGITNDMRQIVKDKLPQEFDALLQSKRINKANDAPYFTVTEANKLLQTHGNTIKQLYGQDALSALRDYHKMMQIISKNKNVSYGGNSTTAEKIFGDLTGKASDWALSKVIPGANIFRYAAKLATAGQQEAVNTLLKDAMLDPVKAKELMQIARTANDTEGARRFGLMLKPYLVQSGVQIGDTINQNQ